MNDQKITINQEQVKTFLSALWPWQEEGFLAISTDGGNGNGLSTKFFSHPLKYDLLINALGRWVSYNAWFSIGLFGDRPQSGRGAVSDVIGIPGLVADIDCQGGIHNEKNLPTKEEALQFISEIPFKPSLIVWSGGGFQVYWLFDEPWIFDSPEDREKASDLSLRWQRFLVVRGKEKKWKLDSVGSLEHLFRIPGMYNCKGDPVSVEIVENNDFIYSVESIQAFLDDLPQEQPQPGEQSAWATIGTVDVLPFSIKHLIQNGAEKGSRSEATGSVLVAMVRANVPEDEIIQCFESEKIGEKYREKGSGRIKWLQDEIQRARDFVGNPGGHLMEWPEPEPITAELKPVEALQEDMIPAPFLPMVRDVCHRMAIPLDFVAIPIVIVAGSVIGTGCRVKPKRRDDWAIIPNLWGGIMGPPSRLKSPALEEVVKRQLGRLESEEIEKHKTVKDSWLQEVEVHKLKKSVLVSEYKNALKKEIKNAKLQ